MMPLRERIGRNLRDVYRAAKSGPEARRTVARRYLFDALRQVVPYVALDGPDGFVLLPTSDRTIAKSVFMSGRWQPEGLLRAVDLAKRHTGRDPLDGQVFLDVGANIGTTTLQAARLGASVIAFEPAPENFR